MTGEADDAPRNNAEETPKRKMPEGKPFAPGNPGRPKGSRNKLGEAFIAALHDDFNEYGVETIAAVRREKPDQYLKVVASLLPREIKIEAVNDLTDDELDKRIKQLAAALSLEIGAGGASEGEATPGQPEQASHISRLQ